MIRYFYVKPEILFIGINPHFGPYARGVPFSNNRSFWDLLSEAGIINIISRPTHGISDLTRREELPGRNKISSMIKLQKPRVVCFIGKITYEKYIGLKDFSYGWQKGISGTKVFVMHSLFAGKLESESKN